MLKKYISLLVVDYLLLKTRQQAENELTYAKPQVTKPRLNHSFGLFQKWNLNLVEVEFPDRSKPMQLCNKSPKQRSNCYHEIIK